MKIIVLVLLCLSYLKANAQLPTSVDSTVANVPGTVSVTKDYRLDILGKKQAEFNKITITNTGARAAKGYRLMVISSSDRDFVFKVRAELLRRYSEQVYMTFQSPFIKLKFGDFVEKSDAESYKRMLVAAKIVPNNIYVVSDIIKLKADKETEDN